MILFFGFFSKKLNLNTALIPFVGNLMDLISIHIGTILYTMGLSPHGFIFGFFS